MNMLRLWHPDRRAGYPNATELKGNSFVTIQDEKLTGFPANADLMDSKRSIPCLRTVEM